MKWKFRFTLVLLLCVVNTTFVYYFARDKFDLAWFYIESKVQSVTDGEYISAKIELAPFNIAYELPIIGNRCSDKRKSPAVKQIYTWQDADGIRHISDKPGLKNAFYQVRLVGQIPPDSVSLNFYGIEEHYAIRPPIVERVNASLQLYKEIVDESLVNPIIINLRLFWTEAEFLFYRQQVAPRLKFNQGFYLSGKNESVVWVRTEEQGIRTSVHEAMHSINRHWIGEMNRWLNEGVAELAEQMPIDRRNMKRYFKGKKLLSLKTLFETPTEKWVEGRAGLEYLTAHAFVAYLYTQDKNTLSRLLLAEAENGCDVLTSQDIESISGRSTERLNRELRNWISMV